jgi:hypothetical protein
MKEGAKEYQREVEKLFMRFFEAAQELGNTMIDVGRLTDDDAKTIIRRVGDDFIRAAAAPDPDLE